MSIPDGTYTHAALCLALAAAAATTHTNGIDIDAVAYNRAAYRPRLLSTAIFILKLSPKPARHNDRREAVSRGRIEEEEKKSIEEKKDPPPCC